MRFGSGARRLAGTLLAVCAMVAGAVHAEGLTQGDLAPERLGRTLGGDELSLATHRGQIVVVTFWATWCPYCLKELPQLESLQNVAKGRLRVIAVNTEDRKVFRRVAGIMKDFKLLLVSDADKSAQKAYGVNALPHLFIIDRDGRIAAMHRGYGEDSLERILEEINAQLAKPVPPSSEGGAGTSGPSAP
ncbi:TlpA family protein disulfide reductase [Roseateles chitinivorans]|uniref:TlpA family protein disulfide reductase n=1 Tax=Roseateles chitinivorans TaxID=2917965 RepID=UPI003D674378